MANRKAKTGAAKVASAKRAAPQPKKAAQPAKALKAATDRAVSRTAKTTIQIAEGNQIMTKDTIENIQANQAATAERFLQDPAGVADLPAGKARVVELARALCGSVR